MRKSRFFNFRTFVGNEFSLPFRSLKPECSEDYEPSQAQYFHVGSKHVGANATFDVREVRSNLIVK